MKVTSRFAGLVIATGDKTNYTKINPQERAGTFFVVQRMVQTLFAAGAYPVVVITGQNAWEVERSLSGCGVIFIRAEDFRELTVFELIQGGCAYLAGNHRLIVISTVEFPYFQADIVKELTQAKCVARVPVCRETPGYPVAIGGEMISRIIKEETAESVIEYLQGQPEISMVETSDEGVILRQDASGKLPEVIKNGECKLHPYLRMEIGSGEKLFEPRLKMLLFLLDETKSMKTASAHSSLLLGRAWECVDLLEEELGFQLVDRVKSSFHSGWDEDKAGLTEEGRDFLSKYVKYERQLMRYAARTFEELFGEKEET